MTILTVGDSGILSESQTFGGKAIENFAYGTKDYTVEIPSDVYESLNESNVAVTKTSDYSDAAITTTVGEETEGTKTVTVKVSTWYGETTYDYSNCWGFWNFI